MEIEFSGWQKAGETHDPYLRGGVVREENIFGYGEIRGKRSIWAPPGRSAVGKCEGVLARGPRKREE